MIIILSIIIPLLLLILFIKLHRKTYKKTVAFVGPRGSGKTRCLYKICRDIAVSTVPTLVSNELIYKDYIIKEIVPIKSDDPFVKYGIDDKTIKYFCFIKSMDDVFDVKDYFIKFVYFGENNKFSSNVICLNNEPNNLVRFIK